MPIIAKKGEKYVMKLDLKLDIWQEKVLKAKGNLCICSGRQTGKSTIVAIKAAHYIVNNPQKQVLIVSVTEDQSFELLQKVLMFLEDNYKSFIAKGKNRPTKNIVRLKNGSLVRTKAVGQSGVGVRGFTIDMLIADEAAFMPEDVWTAVTPMLLTTGGDIILISTPKGRRGYFWKKYNDDAFQVFHINSEEVAKTRKEPQRQVMLEYLQSEKDSMSEKEYMQEYLGIFREDIMQWFSDDLIRTAMSQFNKSAIELHRKYYLGVDIARMGEDESTFEILEKTENGHLYHQYNAKTTKTLLTMTAREILSLDKKYKFKRIYVDDGGLGAGVFDILIEDPQTRRKTLAINNLKRAIEYLPFDDKKPRQKKLMKEELYNNMLRLMEQGKIHLLDSPDIYQSLKSVQYEYNEKGDIRIFGTYTHIAEGLIRAAWCVKDKIFKPWILAV